MAYGSNPGPPSGDSMYTDGPEEGEAKATPDAGEEGEDAGAATAELPKSILAGKDFKPGEEIVLKIVAIHEDAVSVQYAPAEPDKEKGEQVEAPPGMGSPGGDAEMAGMME